MNIKPYIFILTIVLFFTSCNDKNVDEPEKITGKIIFNFLHKVNGHEIKFDTLIYENTAENPYLVNEIQYFISDVILFNNNGSVKLIDDWKDIHYIDTDILSTHSWEVYDEIEQGTYDSVSFIFGISEGKNNSFMYVNPPESYMFWPEYLGGGYHYMKLNGKWLEVGQTIETTPFDFHLGIGQIYDNSDSIIGFVQNYFRVSLPGSGFNIESEQIKEISITMNVENWFENPYIYDHDIWNGYIMQNQEAMQIAKENGRNVFSVLIE